MTEINRYIKALLNKENLSADDVSRAMQIMTLGGATPAQSSAFLTALRMKGYTSEELAGAISFSSFKQRLADFKEPAVFISVTSERADAWIGCSLILASLNIPTYLQFQRTEDMHIGQVLNLDMEIDSELSAECLDEVRLCIAYQRKPKLFRNIVPISQELEFLNLFDITCPCASLVQPLAIVYEQQDYTDQKLLINAFHHTACQAAVVIGEDGKALRLMDNKLYEVNDINSFVEPHKIGVGDKAGRLRAFTHNAETLNQNDIIRKAAEVLLIIKAAPTIEDGIRIAAAAVKERSLHTVLDKVVHISNSMEIDDSAENG
jgi:anthranilate phosphoribosyltransferase